MSFVSFELNSAIIILFTIYTFYLSSVKKVLRTEIYTIVLYFVMDAILSNSYKSQHII